MKNYLRLACLAAIFATLLLSSCSPLVRFRLHNNSGVPITVIGERHNTSLPNGESCIADVLPYKGNPAIGAIQVVLKEKPYFLVVIRNHSDAVDVSQHWKDVGINAKEINVSVAKTGEFVFPP